MAIESTGFLDGFLGQLNKAVESAGGVVTKILEIDATRDLIQAQNAAKIAELQSFANQQPSIPPTGNREAGNSPQPDSETSQQQDAPKSFFQENKEALILGGLGIGALAILLTLSNK